MIATEHLQHGQLDAFADRELPPDQARAVQLHIAECHPCSLRLIEILELKQATAAAGHQFDPSQASLARLTAHLHQGAEPLTQPVTRSVTREPKRSPASSRFAFALWPTLAALLLVAVLLVFGSMRRAGEIQSAEILDQHLATLSSAATPQVLSTDRHTVKPWFEGKLPFSFNLPDATALPPDTALKGADLTWLDGHPAALLLFTIGRHQVSLFIVQRSAFTLAPTASTRSGFTLRSTTAHDLRLIAVGDVEAPQLDRLLSSLAAVQ